MTNTISWTWDAVCPSQVMRSLFAGATAGAALAALSYWVGTAAALGPVNAVQHGALAATAVFVGAFFVWTIGLVAFGLGPWWVLHRIGFRSALSSLIVGFALAFLVDLSFVSHLSGLSAPALPNGAHETLRDATGALEIDYVLTPRGWRHAVDGAAEMGAIGAGVALVIWWTAYHSASGMKQISDAQAAKLGLHATERIKTM